MNRENFAAEADSHKERRTVSEIIRKPVFTVVIAVLLICLELAYAISSSGSERMYQRETTLTPAGSRAEEVLDFSDLDDIELPDGTLRIYRLRFSSHSTAIDVRLFPKENEEDAAKEMAERHGEMELVDETGKTVSYASGMIQANQPQVRLDDWESERWACGYTITLPGLNSRPESIGIKTKQGELLRVPMVRQES